MMACAPLNAASVLCALNVTRPWVSKPAGAKTLQTEALIFPMMVKSAARTCLEKSAVHVAFACTQEWDQMTSMSASACARVRCPV